MIAVGKHVLLYFDLLISSTILWSRLVGGFIIFIHGHQKFAVSLKVTQVPRDLSNEVRLEFR